MNRYQDFVTSTKSHVSDVVPASTSQILFLNQKRDIPMYREVCFVAKTQRIKKI